MQTAQHSQTNVPVCDDVVLAHLTRLQPALRQVAEKYIQVAVRPVRIFLEVISEHPAQRRLELHHVVRVLTGRHEKVRGEKIKQGTKWCTSSSRGKETERDTM